MYRKTGRTDRIATARSLTILLIQVCMIGLFILPAACNTLPNAEPGGRSTPTVGEVETTWVSSNAMLFPGAGAAEYRFNGADTLVSVRVPELSMQNSQVITTEIPKGTRTRLLETDSLDPFGASIVAGIEVLIDQFDLSIDTAGNARLEFSISTWELQTEPVYAVYVRSDATGTMTGALSLDGTRIDWGSLLGTATYLQYDQDGEAETYSTALQDDSALTPWTKGESDVSDDEAGLSGKIYYAGTLVPVSGATVFCGSIIDTTGSDGAFHLPGLSAGLQDVCVEKYGFDNFTMTLDPTKQMTGLDIELTSTDETCVLEGTVTDPEGDAVAGVRVLLLNPDGNDSMLYDSTNLNGTYEVPMIPQGSRTVVWSKEGYRSTELVVHLRERSRVFDVELRLLPQVSVSSPVVADPEDALINVGTAFHAGQEIYFAGRSDSRGDTLSWSSDLDGELGLGETLTIDDLSEGSHVITLTASDDEGWYEEVNFTVDILCPLPAELDGQVWTVFIDPDCGEGTGSLYRDGEVVPNVQEDDFMGTEFRMLRNYGGTRTRVQTIYTCSFNCELGCLEGTVRTTTTSQSGSIGGRQTQSTNPNYNPPSRGSTSRTTEHCFRAYPQAN